MVDMAQADRTLSQKPRPSRQQNQLAWTIALNRAARSMGFTHFIDVPDSQGAEMKAIARGMHSGIASGLQRQLGPR